MAMESPAAFNQTGGSYTAEQTRRAVFAAYARTAANTPGILTGGLLSTADMQLSAPGSGLSVNVSTGEAIVGGGEGGVQGGYYARNASTTNLVISTANPTNPRIDTIALTIADSGYTEPTGVSGNAAVLQVVTGTATSGATLVNLTGKATLPVSSLLLGYCLVPATATNIITADIANVAATVQLQNPRRASFLQPAAASNYTTTSTTLVVVDGTNLSATVQCSGSPIKVTFVGSANVSTGAQTLTIENQMDAASGGPGAAFLNTTAFSSFCVMTVFQPTAGSHTFAPYWALTGAATATIVRSGGISPVLVIEELGPSPA